jgi:hypothetical protein
LLQTTTTLNIAFSSAAGRTYSLRQSDNLITWTNTPNQPSLAGNGFTQSFIVPDPGVPARFYQVAVTLP